MKTCKWLRQRHEKSSFLLCIIKVAQGCRRLIGKIKTKKIAKEKLCLFKYLSTTAVNNTK